MNPGSFVSMNALIGFRVRKALIKLISVIPHIWISGCFFFLACLILLKVLRFICMFIRCFFSHYMYIIVTIKIVQTKGKTEWTCKQLIINYRELLKGWLSILSNFFCCQIHGLVL